jgi:aminoglycoside/choline kinase family phosphotransferase
MTKTDKIIEPELQRLGAKLPIQWRPLPGDASNRVYTRLTDALQKSWMLMEFDSNPQSLAEEKTPGDMLRIQELPFVNIGNFFSAHSVQVPDIYSQGKGEGGKGFLLLEDLGDETLYQWWQTHHKTALDQVLPLYKRAIEEMLKIHRITLEADAEDLAGCIATTRKFDAALYNWEFEHFVDYGIIWPLQKKQTYKKLKNFFSSLSEQLTRLPLCITHRDFHSKNLLLKPDHSVWVIDFQDAIMGPPHYDLASLLFDSYIDLPNAMVEELISYYWERAGEALTGDSLDFFKQELRVMALQRNLKAAGRFIYIYAEKHKSTHIPYVIPTLNKVRSHLDFLGANQEFRDLIPFSEIEAAVLKLAPK